MPSILRQAIGAMKDQTSIGIAKFSKRSSSHIEVAVLKATSHDEVPIDERHMTEVLLLAAATPSSADACVQALSRRISRTSNWVVALKSLVVIFRFLRNGGSQFIHEALTPPPGSRRLLDLSTFRDQSATSSPWDYTAFVRTFADYLDARLESVLLGNLSNLGRRPIIAANIFANMKMPLILEHIEHWRRLLDRAIGTRPTGPAKTNRLVQIALYFVVCETFCLYHDVSNGLSLLLDNFFHLQHAACLKTFEACMKARRQFEELESFYDLCKKIGVGRMSEYPSVQKISGTLLKALEEFLKNRPNSLTTSPNTKLESPSKQITSAVLQQKLRDQEFETTSREMMSDWESVMSDHKEWQLQERSSNSSISSGDNCVVKDIILVDRQQKASRDLDPDDEWEILLVRSMNDMAAKEDSFSPMQAPKPRPSESSLSQRIANQPAQNLQNPFLHNNDSRSLVVIPQQYSLTPPPTFRAMSLNEELAFEENHFSTPFNVRSSNTVQRIDALVQQRVLREQHMWMQQQSKIIAKRLAC